MEKNFQQEILKFIQPSKWIFIGGIVLILSSLALLVPTLITPLTQRAKTGSFYLEAYCFIFGAVLLGIYFYLKIKSKNILERIENTGGEYMLKNDFYNGEKLGSLGMDFVILGDVFVIGKSTAAIFYYDDIKMVYQQIYKHRIGEMFRKVKIVLSDKKTVTLCTIYDNTVSERISDRIFTALRKKNQFIEIGERKETII